MNIKKYVIGGQEIHIIDGAVSVAVCWNIEEKRKTIEQDGIEYSAVVPIRKGKPYISFITLCYDGYDDFYVDDDSSVDGGLSLSKGWSVLEELRKACEYIREATWSKLKEDNSDDVSPPDIDPPEFICPKTP